MIFTINELLRDPFVLKAVIDRTVAIEQDKQLWRTFLDFEQTKSRVFRTYIGTQTGVRMGSVISKHGGKPIRQRHAMGKGYGEVATLGDKFQMDNDRLELLQDLVAKYNETSGGNIVEVVNHLVQDFRELTLAPHKRMDKVVGDLLSKGEAHVKVDDNRDGVEGLDITLPFVKTKAKASDKNKMLPFLQDMAEKHAKLGSTVMLMSRKTFSGKFAMSEEFKMQYKQAFGSSEVITSGGAMTVEMANSIFSALGLPRAVIIGDHVEDQDGNLQQVFADDKITFMPTLKVGKMRWHTPYEATDPVTGKAYTTLEAGMFISTHRTEEGRFLEYGCEWIPEITVPHRILNIDLSAVK